MSAGGFDDAAVDGDAAAVLIFIAADAGVPAEADVVHRAQLAYVLAGGLGVNSQAVATVDTDAAVDGEAGIIGQDQVHIAADGDTATDGQASVLHHIPSGFPSCAPTGVRAGHNGGAGAFRIIIPCFAGTVIGAIENIGGRIINHRCILFIHRGDQHQGQGQFLGAVFQDVAIRKGGFEEALRLIGYALNFYGRGALRGRLIGPLPQGQLLFPKEDRAGEHSLNDLVGFFVAQIGGEFLGSNGQDHAAGIFVDVLIIIPQPAGDHNGFRFGGFRGGFVQGREIFRQSGVLVQGKQSLFFRRQGFHRRLDGGQLLPGLGFGFRRQLLHGGKGVDQGLDRAEDAFFLILFVGAKGDLFALTFGIIRRANQATFGCILGFALLFAGATFGYIPILLLVLGVLGILGVLSILEVLSVLGVLGILRLLLGLIADFADEVAGAARYRFLIAAAFIMLMGAVVGLPIAAGAVGAGMGAGRCLLIAADRVMAVIAARAGKVRTGAIAAGMGAAFAVLPAFFGMDMVAVHHRGIAAIAVPADMIALHRVPVATGAVMLVGTGHRLLIAAGRVMLMAAGLIGNLCHIAAFGGMLRVVVAPFREGRHRRHRKHHAQAQHHGQQPPTQVLFHPVFHRKSLLFQGG